MRISEVNVGDSIRGPSGAVYRVIRVGEGRVTVCTPYTCQYVDNTLRLDETALVMFDAVRDTPDDS